MSEREAIQTDEGGGGKNCEPRTSRATPSPTVHPPEVFPLTTSATDDVSAPNLMAAAYEYLYKSPLGFATFTCTCSCGNHISGTYRLNTIPEFYCVQCGKRHPHAEDLPFIAALDAQHTQRVQPPEAFPLPSVSDLLHLDVLSTVEALRALPQSKVVLLRLEHP